jgi:hypothetical protein
MRARTILLMVCLLASPVASGAAPTSGKRARMPMVAKAPTGPAAAPRVAPRVAPRSHATPARPAKPHETPAAAAANAAPRKLQDIHIEGEIPVPQVLFITARDQRRFVDFQQRRYLRTSRELAEQTNFPARISLVGNAPSETRKETP